MVTIGITKENILDEKRVCLIPEHVYKLKKLGFTVFVEKNAGIFSGFDDENYLCNGAIIKNKKEVFKSDIIFRYNFFNYEEIKLLNNNVILVCLYVNKNYKKYIKELKKKKITLIFLEKLPRLSRIQFFDVLSTISNISGYRSVIEAIYEIREFFSGQITASGNINPIKVLIIGAGVSGLSAINLCRLLGANVFVYDPRKEIKEYIESTGSNFIKLNNLYKNIDDYLYKNISSYKVIICSAVNKKNIAPKIITEKIIKCMKKNSIIIDLVIRNGGNCTLSVNNKKIFYKNKIKIISYYDFSNLMPSVTSKLYGNNLINFICFIFDLKKKKFIFNFKDEVLKNIIFLFNGFNLKKKKLFIEKKIYKKFILEKDNVNIFLNNKLIFFSFFILFFILKFNNKRFFNIIFFLYSCILGFFITQKIDGFLHTPLISITNALSGIISIGCLSQINIKNNFFINLIATFSLFLININIFSGFYITLKILNMFDKNK